jgi:hydrogenase nickel incorporation protein HypA/HybF
MHEMSVAQNIIDIVNEHIPEGTTAGVSAVRLRIGKMAGIVTDSLEFCFEAIIKDTPLESARLDIFIEPLIVRCQACNSTSEIDDPAFLCPVCGSIGVELISGTELQVTEIELNE